MKYLNMMIYYKIQQWFSEQYCQLEVVGLSCYQCMSWNPMRVFILFFIIKIVEYEFVLHNLYCTNCIIQIHTNSYSFYTNCIVRIHTRCGFCTNSYNFYTKCIVRIHTRCDFVLVCVARAASAKPELRARSASCKGKAQAGSAQREPRLHIPSLPPTPTRPHPAAPTIRVHPTAPTSQGAFMGGLGQKWD